MLALHLEDENARRMLSELERAGQQGPRDLPGRFTREGLLVHLDHLLQKSSVEADLFVPVGALKGGRCREREGPHPVEHGLVEGPR